MEQLSTILEEKRLSNNIKLVRNNTSLYIWLIDEGSRYLIISDTNQDHLISYFKKIVNFIEDLKKNKIDIGLVIKLGMKNLSN
jgi:uncharacterized protein (UPF0128 family)